MTVITLTSRQPSSRKPSKDSSARHGSISRKLLQQRHPEDAVSAKRKEEQRDHLREGKRPRRTVFRARARNINRRSRHKCSRRCSFQPGPINISLTIASLRCVILSSLHNRARTRVGRSRNRRRKDGGGRFARAILPVYFS